MRVEAAREELIRGAVEKPDVFQTRSRCPTTTRRAGRCRAGMRPSRPAGSSRDRTTSATACSAKAREASQAAYGTMLADTTEDAPEGAEADGLALPTSQISNKVPSTVAADERVPGLQADELVEAPRQSIRRGHLPDETRRDANGFDVHRERLEPFRRDPPERVASDATADRAFSARGRTRQTEPIWAMLLAGLTGHGFFDNSPPPPRLSENFDYADGPGLTEGPTMLDNMLYRTECRLGRVCVPQGTRIAAQPLGLHGAAKSGGSQS